MGAEMPPLYMKNKIATLKNTWTYKHKSLIIIASLLVALYYPVYVAPHMPTLEAATIEHVNPPLVAPQDALEAKIEARTLELYKALEPVNMERARQEAIRELGHELIELSYTSPYIDYEELRAKVAQ